MKNFNLLLCGIALLAFTASITTSQAEPVQYGAQTELTQGTTLSPEAIVYKLHAVCNYDFLLQVVETPVDTYGTPAIASGYRTEPVKPPSPIQRFNFIRPPLRSWS